MNNKEEFDLLMAFPKYRRLVKRHKEVLKDNKNLRRNWEEQIVINDSLKDKIKKKDRKIYMLKKELKELMEGDLPK